MKIEEIISAYQNCKQLSISAFALSRFSGSLLVAYLYLRVLRELIKKKVDIFLNG